MTYAEAKRSARALFGVHGDAVELTQVTPFRYRIGVWTSNRFVVIGAGESWEVAIEDAKSRQVKENQA